jgi:hypothetical protein
MKADARKLQAEQPDLTRRSGVRGTQNASVQVLLGVAALAVAYLLYANWQASLRVSRSAAEGFQGVIALRSEQGGVQFFRDQGSGRPTLMAGDGKPLLEFSDSYSTLFVDGASSTLWQFPHSYAVDTDRQRLYHSIRGPGWELQQVVSLAGPEKAVVDYFFTAFGPVKRVDLLVQHFHWWYSDVRRQADGFVALVPAGSQEQIERGVNTHPAYEVSVRVAEGLSTRAAEPVRLGLASQYGIGSVVVSLSASSPPFNERVKLGSEQISWRSAPSPG